VLNHLLNDMKGSIKVVIVDGLNLYREGIIKILEKEDDIDIVGESSISIEAVKLAQDKKPDVMILDSKPNINCFEIVRLVKQKSINTGLLLLLDAYDEDLVISAIQAGASGFVLKMSGSEELIKAVRIVAAGELWVKRQTTENLIKTFMTQHNGGRSYYEHILDNRLTKKQLEVVKLVIMGCSNKEIAQKLFISEKTVKSHLYRIFKKLKVNRRVQLAKYDSLMAFPRLKENNF